MAAGDLWLFSIRAG